MHFGDAEPCCEVEHAVHQQPAEPVPRYIAAQRDGELRATIVAGETNHAENAAAIGGQCKQRDVVLVVDMAEPPGQLGRQLAQRNEEAQPAILRRHIGHKVAQQFAIVWADRPQEHLKAVGQPNMLLQLGGISAHR